MFTERENGERDANMTGEVGGELKQGHWRQNMEQRQTVRVHTGFQSVCLSLLFPLVQHHVFECVYAIRDPLQPVQLFQLSRSSVSCPVHPLIITNTSLHLSVSPAFGASFPCIHTQHKPWHRLAKKNEHYQKQHRARKDCSHYVFNLCLKWSLILYFWFWCLTKGKTDQIDRWLLEELLEILLLRVWWAISIVNINLWNEVVKYAVIPVVVMVTVSRLTHPQFSVFI